MDGSEYRIVYRFYPEQDLVEVILVGKRNVDFLTRPERAVIPKPRDLGLVFHPPLHTIVKNHVPSYTESTDYYPISEIRSRQPIGTV